MPRVNRDNRDLQRRLAARRGRDRRRPPTEQRYRFAPAERVDTPAEVEDEPSDSAPELVPTRGAEPARAGPTPPRSRTSAAPRTTPRPDAKPFSAYAAEYAYVANDLRRVALVVGSLLVVLIVLHFALPR
jgi:cell division septation protein DedD